MISLHGRVRGFTLTRVMPVAWNSNEGERLRGVSVDVKSTHQHEDGLVERKVVTAEVSNRARLEVKV